MNALKSGRTKTNKLGAPSKSKVHLPCRNTSAVSSNPEFKKAVKFHSQISDVTASEFIACMVDLLTIETNIIRKPLKWDPNTGEPIEFSETAIDVNTKVEIVGDRMMSDWGDKLLNMIEFASKLKVKEPIVVPINLEDRMLLIEHTSIVTGGDHWGTTSQKGLRIKLVCIKRALA